MKNYGPFPVPSRSSHEAWCKEKDRQACGLAFIGVPMFEMTPLTCSGVGLQVFEAANRWLLTEFMHALQGNPALDLPLERRQSQVRERRCKGAFVGGETWIEVELCEILRPNETDETPTLQIPPPCPRQHQNSLQVGAAEQGNNVRHFPLHEERSHAKTMASKSATYSAIESSGASDHS